MLRFDRGAQQRPIGGDCEAGAPRRKAGGRDGGRETRGVKVGKEVRAVLGTRGRVGSQKPLTRNTGMSIN